MIERTLAYLDFSEFLRERCGWTEKDIEAAKDRDNFVEQ